MNEADVHMAPAPKMIQQGSAADICKTAMLDCTAALKSRGLEAKLLLQIHDELIWEVADQHLHQTADVVREVLDHDVARRLELRVPLPVCITTGKTLASMEPLHTHVPPQQ